MKRANKPWTEDDIHAAMLMLEAGSTYKDVARVMDRHVSSLYDMVKRQEKAKRQAVEAERRDIPKELNFPVMLGVDVRTGAILVNRVEEALGFGYGKGYQDA